MLIDIFRDDAFSTVSLTDALLKAPHKPGRIGQLGLFRGGGITTTTVVVEEKDGQLTLIESSPRGGPGSTVGQAKRTARAFSVPHFERSAPIYADSLQNVRAFGSDNTLAAIQAMVAEKQATLRAMHEVTLEYLRLGAIKGLILDGDGATTLFNLFTEFGVSQHVVDIDLGSDPRNECVAIARLIEAELGAEPISGFHAFCGDAFFDTLVGNSAVKESFKYQEGVVLRTDLRQGFLYGGITWENYRGSVGGVGFIDTDEAYVFPLGTNIFKTYFAPADYMETVNTLGLPIYSKILPDPSGADKFVKVDSQSNPMPLCLRPRAVVKVTGAS